MLVQQNRVAAVSPSAGPLMHFDPGAEKNKANDSSLVSFRAMFIRLV